MHIYTSVLYVSDDHGEEESMQALEELEEVDDDCDKHGIQFVKIDDAGAADEYGLESLPAVVYFERGIPNVYDGDLEQEEQVLEWLVQQLEKDEIEDVTDEMLDKLIAEGKTIAVLFCEYARLMGCIIKAFCTLPLIVTGQLCRLSK